MSKFTKFLLILIFFMVSACGYNPYGQGLLNASTKKCDKLVESMARENCYEEVNESYQSIREREDRKKRNDNSNLDFKRKKEPALTNDTQLNNKNTN